MFVDLHEPVALRQSDLLFDIHSAFVNTCATLCIMCDASLYIIPIP